MGEAKSGLRSKPICASQIKASDNTNGGAKPNPTVNMAIGATVECIAL
jgi:hypothetical protein